MKRLLYLIMIFFTILSLMSFSSYALEEDVSKKIKSDVGFSENSGKVYDFFSFGNLTELVTNTVKSAFTPTYTLFKGLVGMIIISAVINSFGINLGGFDIASYISALCFSGCCFGIIKNISESLEIYTKKLTDISTVIAPSLIAANASDGIMTAKTGYTGLVTVAVVAEYLVTYLVLPCVKVLFVLSLVSCITSKTIDLKAILSSARTFTVFAVSLVMTGIVTVMHFQNVIAKAVDSVGLRAIRFTSTSLIPIIGGLVGESVKTVAEALRAVKGITGALGVSAVITACLPPLAALTVFKLELIFCSVLARMLGCTNEAAMLSETNGIINVLNAAILASTIAFAAVICIASSTV